MIAKRSAAILTGPSTYLDHIGILSHILEIPLILSDEETLATCQKFYPSLQPTFIPAEELSLEKIATCYDVLFATGKFWTLSLSPIFEKLYHKNMRFVFCPHGNSDKGRNQAIHSSQDISLFYGQHMLDLLMQSHAIEHTKDVIPTGNYRKAFYLENKELYDKIAHKHLSPLLDPTRKTLLYAPTWEDGENPSSFFFSIEPFLKNLAQKYNVMVKLHPFLIEFHPAHTYYILSQCEEIQHVHVLADFPLIYPLLEQIDAYIGDYSSIGYDVLCFDKPLYFLIHKEDPSNVLHPCGMKIPDLVFAEKFITETLDSNIVDKRNCRKALEQYAFGKDKTTKEIKRAIEEKLHYLLEK